MMARRQGLDGSVPERVVRAKPLPAPAPDVFTELLAGTGEKLQASTTTAFARLARKLLADEQIGHRVVPIIPDEARTFGLDALFRDVKIYSPIGQRYEPVDASLLLSYREAKTGRILEEGINEAGAMASMTAAGTAYATWGQPMIPFFIFYSMFGFQRVGDLVWAFGDQRGRGFMLGATAGRTTLTGEGLQHCDGQSQVLATAVPNCRAYDPAFAYEMAVIVRHGIERMYGPEPDDCFYYLTLYNENHPMPGMPAGVEDGIVRGLYRYRAAPEERSHRAQILASGTMMQAALEAQQLLASEHDVAADVWSATGYKQLRDDALERRALEPAAPERRAAHSVRHRAAAGGAGPDRRGDRLPEVGAGPGGAVRAAAVHPARHRRLRLLRHPRGAAPALRGGRAAHRRGDPRRARAAGATSRARSWRTRSAPTASTRRLRTPAPLDPGRSLNAEPLTVRSSVHSIRSVAGVALLVGVPGLLRAAEVVVVLQVHDARFLVVHVRKAPAAVAEHAVVEPLLQLAGLTEPARSSFSGHASPTPDRASLIPSSGQLSRISRRRVEQAAQGVSSRPSGGRKARFP